MRKFNFPKRIAAVILTLSFIFESSATSISFISNSPNIEPFEVVPIPIETPPDIIYPDTKRTTSTSSRPLDELMKLDNVITDSSGRVIKLDISTEGFTPEEKLLLLTGQTQSVTKAISLLPSNIPNSKFKTASLLHGGDAPLMRELTSLDFGMEHNNLNEVEYNDILHLICNGYTYSQARAALISASILDCSIAYLCQEKIAEISQNQTNSSSDNELSESFVSSPFYDDYKKLSIQMGVPYNAIKTYMDQNETKLTTLSSAFQSARHTLTSNDITKTDIKKYDSTPLTTSYSTTRSSSINYAPEHILENPYNIKDYGELDINTATGTYKFRTTDLSIPGINGLDLNITRYFDSSFSMAEIPLGLNTGECDNDYTLLVSYDIYISYDAVNYSPISDFSGYVLWDYEKHTRVETDSMLFKTIDYEKAVAYKNTLYAEVGAAIYVAYDPYGDDVFVILQPTIKAVGNYDDAFENDVRDYDYLVTEFGLGHGWRFAFSSIENYIAGYKDPIAGDDRTQKKKRLILSDGRIFNLNGTEIESELDDMTLSATGGNYPGASYTLTYADGKKEYFDSNGRNIAIVDRFGNTISLEYTISPATGSVTQIKITDTLGNIVIYKEETVSFGSSGYANLPGLSSLRGSYNRKHILTLNGETIRSYYSFADPTNDRYPIELKVVENEFGQYTTFVHSRGKLYFNSFVSSASTNDSYIYKTMLTDIRFPNDLEFSITHRKTPIYMGDGGYEEATPITGTHYHYNENDITSNRNHYKFIIGDYTGYTTGFYGDDTYTTIETLSHYKSAPYEKSVWSWGSTQTSYTFNSEHELYIHEVKTYDTKPEDSISITNNDLYAGIQGTANIATYSYTDAHLVSSANVKTYEPGSTSSFVEQNYSYTYDNKGNILTEKLPNNQTITYTYSPEYSILLTKTYNQNNSTSIVEQNLLTADKKAIAQEQVLINGTLGAKRTFSYNTNGQVAAINTYTSASQCTTQQVSYNNSAQPTQIMIKDVKNADNTSASATPGFGAGTIAEKTTYNSRGWPTSYTDGNGKVTFISYDAAGRISQVSYPNGGTESYVYDLENNTVTYTDIKNNVFTYSYNPFGDLEKIFDEISQQALVTYHYDSVGNMDIETIHSTDSTKDKVTYYHYDNLKRPIEVGIRNFDGTSTPLETYTYNAASGKTTHTVLGSGNAPSQVNTTYVDKMGNTIMRGRILNGSEFVDNYTYDYLGNCIKFVSAYMSNQNGSPSTQYTYDYSSNMLSETDPLGNTKTYTYDWSGNLVQSKDAKLNIITNYYDALGRLIKTTTPIDTNYNNVVMYYYDSAGNVTKQLTSTGTAHTNGTPTNYDSVLYTYDSMNRLTAVETPISSSVTDYTTYVYDLAGNIIQMNAGGRKSGSTITSVPSTTTYTYDRFGNVLTEKNAANATESYTYDLNGAMLTKTDRKGVQTLYSYDNRGKVLSKTIGSGAAQLVHSYTYGLNGALLSESQGGNTITYKYDELGRLTEEYTAPFYKKYTYNIADLRTSFSLDFPELEDCPRIYENYYYDAAGRLTRVADYMSYLDVSYTYDTNNNITGTSYYAGPDQTYTYNSANQIVTVTTPTNTTPLTQHSYTYDLAGRQISVTDTAGTTTAYAYDTKGQLTAENRTGGTSAQNYSKAYTYDPRGNRIALANSGTSTSYTYNAVNHLQNSTTSGTVTTYTYDANGNTLTDQTGTASALTYTYDVENRLIAVSGDNLNVTYEYYPNGLRMSKTVNGNMTLYVWDGDQLVFELGYGETKYLRGLSLFAKFLLGIIPRNSTSMMVMVT